MLKSLMLCIVFCFGSVILIGQEICDNAIDDDGDGLIDLNDDECNCSGGTPELLLFEFEDKSCCPLGLGMVGCLDNWDDATLATPDYIHSCASPAHPLLPFPSGEGCVGFVSYSSHMEYIYTCLPNQIIAGETYNVGFYMGFNNIQSSSPFEYAIYGKTTCNDLPEVAQTCLINLPTWTELAIFTAAAIPNTNTSWVYTSNSFVSPGDFEALAIGPACPSNADNNYHFVDDFSIEGIFTQEPPTIIESGDCSSGLTLTADHPKAISYQWYYNGIAIIGEVNQTTLVNYPNNGPYTVVAYTPNGCIISEPYLVDINPESLLFNGNIINNLCYGDNNGSIQITNINSQSNPFDYSWDNSEVTDQINNLSEGTFVVTVTDNNGCFGSNTFSLVDPDVLEVVVTQIIQPQPPSILGCAEISILGGTPFYDINWNNGEGTTKVFLEEGTHTVTVTDENGCSDSTSVQIGAAMSFSVITSDSLCTNDCSGSIVLFPIGGSAPYDIQWSNGMSGDTISNLCAQLYSATITDINNSILEVDIEINNLPLVEINANFSDTICSYSSNGFIHTDIVNGAGPFSLLWSNGSIINNIDSLSSGTYDLTIVDNNLCNYHYQYDINESEQILPYFNVIPAECGQNNGQILMDSINGSGPFKYNWSTGDSTAKLQNIPSGEYFLTITDINYCTVYDTIILSNLDEPIITVDIEDNSCPYNQDGSIRITKVDGTQPPFFYNWSTGDSIRSIDSLAPGKYYLTVTYNNGCISVNEYIIDQLSAIDTDSIIIDESCLGKNDGHIDIAIIDGVSPHLFNWDNGQTSNSINNLSPGFYNLTITDSIGCQYPLSYQVQQGGVVTASADVTNPSCAGLNNGSIEITPNGIPPFDFIWDNGTTSQNNIDLSKGFHNLQIEDSLGCIENYNYFLINPPPISISSSILQPGCDEADSVGQINIFPSGGTGSLKILWESGSTDSTLINLDPGEFIVTITDEQQCIHNDTFQIIETSPLVTFSNIDSILCADEFGHITIEILNGTAPYSFLWNNGSIDSINNNLTSGNYFVEIKDNTGCVDTLYFELFEPSNISTTTIQNISPSIAGNDGLLEIMPSGGTPPFNVVWNNGDVGNLIQGLGYGTYTATITDANGCKGETSYTFSPLPLSVNYNSNNNNCFAECLGTIDLNVLGGITPYTYNWSNGIQDSFLNNLCAGLYNVTIEDAVGTTFIIDDIEIFNPLQIDPIVNSSGISCINLEDGSLNIQLSGGTAPYLIYNDNMLVDTLIENLSPGIYDILIIDNNGCKFDSTFNIIGLDPLITNINIEDINCLNESGSINITSQNTNNYALFLNNEFIGESNDITIEDLSAGVYQFEYQINEDCTVDVDSIEIIDETNLLITASPSYVQTNSETNFNIELEIDGIDSLISEITWNEIDGDVSCIDYNIENHCVSFSLQLTTSDTLHLSVLLTNGCIKSISIPIEIVENLDFDFPNAFSPNGDNINDILDFSFLPPNIKVQQLDIFDRWGNKVYRLDNNINAAGWDGKSNGKLVSQGVYIYLLTIVNSKGETKNYYGDITLIR